MRPATASPALVARLRVDGERHAVEAPRAVSDELADDLASSGLGHVVSEPVLRVIAALVSTLIDADGRSEEPR